MPPAPVWLWPILIPIELIGVISNNKCLGSVVHNKFIKGGMLYPVIEHVFPESICQLVKFPSSNCKLVGHWLKLFELIPIRMKIKNKRILNFIKKI
jgi:hypothetical protein